ncbi:unnamed protein product [Polarella glacialis]|uniref:CSD domain-containing protein n=1 Tax=Polarella glacialis TaxID=89957 RepID=A0A813G853_POLGL|nr:unnamed protein product [Polarella glacialis]
MAGRYSGVVKSWNGSKGYGFLSSPQITGDVMFLRSHLPADAKEVRGKFLEGKTVNFDLTTGPDGRAQGANMQITAAEGDFVAGEVKSYSERHGYGFITSSSLKGEVRFNRTDLDALLPGVDLKGELVICKVLLMPDGKLRAEKIMFQSSKIANRLKAGGMMGFGKGGGKGGFGQMDYGMDGNGFGKGGFGKGGFGQGYGMMDYGMDGNGFGKGGFGKGGFGKGGFGDDGRDQGQGAQGIVIAYNSGKGYGFLKCGKADSDVYFKSQDAYQEGAIVSFTLKINKDGKPSAINLQPGISSGQTYTGTVKTFLDTKGYGFISVPGQPSDVYFNKDLAPAALQNGSLVGKSVRFTVQVSADGKARAEQGAQFY